MPEGQSDRMTSDMAMVLDAGMYIGWTEGKGKRKQIEKFLDEKKKIGKFCFIFKNVIECLI